jgi:hypothetical protein
MLASFLCAERDGGEGPVTKLLAIRERSQNQDAALSAVAFEE